MPVNIDMLEPTRNLIDMGSYQDGEFGIEDYVLSKVFGDIILVQFMDLNEDGDFIQRNGVLLPTNAVRSAWRKGKVLLTGVDVKYCKVGDIVLFPHDRGLTVANVDVKGVGRLKKGMFLNEQRLFGICTPKNEDIEGSAGADALN